MRDSKWNWSYDISIKLSRGQKRTSFFFHNCSIGGTITKGVQTTNVVENNSLRMLDHCMDTLPEKAQPLLKLGRCFLCYWLLHSRLFQNNVFFTFTICSLKVSLFLCLIGQRKLCAKGTHCCLLLMIIIFIFWNQTDFANLVANLVIFGTHQKLWLWKGLWRCFLEGFLENEDEFSKAGVTFCRDWIIEIAEAKVGLFLPAHPSFRSMRTSNPLLLWPLTFLSSAENQLLCLPTWTEDLWLS